MAFWFIQAPGWLLFAYLLIAQGLAAVNYDLGVRMGTQEPASQITEVGAAFWWGIAAADLVFYTPLLGIALVGHWVGAGWATPALAAALGITVYWPILSLFTVVRARNAPGWSLPKEHQYWMVLPLIALWAAAALIWICASP